MKITETKLTLMQAAEAGDEARIREIVQKDQKQLLDTDKVRTKGHFS